MRSYLYLIAAMTIALVGSTCLKLSYGFTVLWPTIICIVTYALSYYWFAVALKDMALSLGYAIWSAFSIICNALISYFYFGEPMSELKVGCFAVIILGTVLINNAHKEEQ